MLLWSQDSSAVLARKADDQYIPLHQCIGVNNSALCLANEACGATALTGKTAEEGVLYFRSLGCLDLDCNLCKQTPHRRCTSTFAGKYLSGDMLKAKCGARIRLEVIDRRTGDSVPAHVLRDTQVEVRQLPHV